MTQPDTTLLQQLDRAGPYRLGRNQAAPLHEAAAALGFRVFQVAPADASGKEAWLAALATSLAFPDHFGANFDALYDCLTDPDWQPGAPGILLMLGQLAPLGEEVDILIAVLQAAADDLRDRGQPFWAFLDAPGLDLDVL